MYQHLIQSLLSEVENSPMQHRYVYAYRYQNDTYTAILAQILPDPRFPGPSTSTDNTSSVLKNVFKRRLILIKR